MSRFAVEPRWLFLSAADDVALPSAEEGDALERPEERSPIFAARG